MMHDSPDMTVGRLLAARRSLRDTKWDGTHLDHFIQVLCRLDGRRHSFALDDLHAVECAWTGEAEGAWRGGFVARLKDGRRAHVDGRAGGSYWAEDSDIETGLLHNGEAHPEPSERHGWQDQAWRDELADMLNALLDRLAPPDPASSREDAS